MKQVVVDKDTVKLGRPLHERHRFSDDHPQSLTHSQIVRANGLVPCLSMLPPSSTNNKNKYQKCMLLLFKPFRLFTDLFNGISWDESYETTEFTKYIHCIENIQEMHIGIQQRKDDHNDENGENNDETIDFAFDELDDDPMELNETDIDTQTTDALDIIKNSGWLEESTSIQQSIQPVFENSSLLPGINTWTQDIKKQNKDKRNNIEEMSAKSKNNFFLSESLRQHRMIVMLDFLLRHLMI